MTPMQITLFVMLLITLLFLWGKLPYSVTSILGLSILLFTGVLTKDEAFAGFIETNIILLVSMFVVTGGLMRTSLLDKIQGLIGRIRGGECAVIFSFMAIEFLLVHFMSVVGSIVTILPMMLAVCADGKVGKKRLLYTTAAIGHISISLWPIGKGASGVFRTNAQMIALGATEQFTIWNHALAKTPGVLLAFLFVGFVGYKLLPKDAAADSQGTEMRQGKEKKKKTPLSKGKETLAYVIAIGTTVGLLAGTSLGWNLWQVAMVGALIMACSGVLTEKEIYESINLSAVFMIGGLLCISTALAKTGAGELIADGIIRLLGGSTNPYFIVAVFYIVPALCTQFLSNTASANVFIPLAIVTALKLGIDPRPCVLAANIGALSSVLTPMSAPGMAIIFSTGNFKISEFVKAGLPIIVIVGLSCIFLIPLFFPF